MTKATPRSRLRSWAYALRTTNPPPDGRVDAVTRWIVVSRAAVLPMTLVSGLVAALLAVGHPALDVRWLVLAIVGITLAHVANNLMNDLYDTQAGSDSATYPRALYAPHPVLSGLVSRRTLVAAIVAVNAADLAILVVLALARGWPVVAFALAGFVLSVAYTAPPPLGMMVACYVLVGVAVLVGAMPWPALLVLAALPRLVKVWPHFRRPPPAEPPPRFPVWPLWYAALAWVHVRQAGALLVLGLALGTLV